MTEYRLVLEPQDNGIFLVTCPELPEVVSFGETKNEAFFYGCKAVSEALAARRARVSKAPDPDPR